MRSQRDGTTGGYRRPPADVDPASVQIAYVHPCRGVKIPSVPRAPRTIITPEQFDALYGALTGAMYQLLVETDIESALRWGELTELRVRDVRRPSFVLNVLRLCDLTVFGWIVAMVYAFKWPADPDPVRWERSRHW